MIAFRDIENHLVKIARDGVGKYLSRTGNGVDKTPSVIKARPYGAIPDYPFVTIDLVDNKQTTGWIQETVLNEDESLTYKTARTLLYQYTVYGSNDKLRLRAMDIASELEGYFRLPNVMYEMETDGFCTFEQTFSVIDNPVRTNAEKWLETAYFTFTVTAEDNLTYGGNGVFDSVDLDGEVCRTQDDSSPLPINIKVP